MQAVEEVRPNRPSLWHPGREGHLIPLDGLRGIAVFVVMLYHFGGMLSLDHPGTLWARRLVSPGWCGVDLFFVLSGFLITGILLANRGSTQFFRSFLARRALRIFPVYYGVMALITAVLWAAPHPSPQTVWLRDRLGWFWLHASNYLFASTGAWPMNEWFDIGHFWSLAVEEHFYLVWPATVLTCSPRVLWRLSLALVVALPFVRWAAAPQVGAFGIFLLTPFRVDSLLMGALLAQAVRNDEVAATLLCNARRILIAGPVALGALALGRRGFDPEDLVVAVAGFPLIALTAAALITVILEQRAKPSFVQRFWSHPFWVFLGRYSYGIYVYHGVVRPLFRSTLAPLVATGGTLTGSLLFMLGSMGISVALAWLSYHAFESRFLRLKRFFPYHQDPANPTTQRAQVHGFKESDLRVSSGK